MVAPLLLEKVKQIGRRGSSTGDVGQVLAIFGVGYVDENWFECVVHGL